MEISETLYVTNPKDWRKWLEKHHGKKSEIWLIYYNKASGKERIPYNDAVDEALCFGWIDSTVKKVDKDSFAQRFTPRKPKSNWSELNKERVRRLTKQKKMTRAGLAVAPKVDDEFEVSADILKQLKKDPEIWENFEKFPEGYKRIRIGFIEDSRSRKDIFKQRLNYFLKMTKQKKKFGMVQ